MERGRFINFETSRRNVVGGVEKPVYGAEGDFIEKFRPTSRIARLLSHLVRYIGQMTLLARWRNAYGRGSLRSPTVYRTDR